MNSEMNIHLETLGLESGKVPKMKEVRKQFLKLANIRHPDKPNGTDELMKELLNAYQKVGKFLEEMKPEDMNDEEEMSAREQFKQFNFSNINKNSVSMAIFSIHRAGWKEECSQTNLVLQLITPNQKMGKSGH